MKGTDQEVQPNKGGIERGWEGSEPVEGSFSPRSQGALPTCPALHPCAHHEQGSSPGSECPECVGFLTWAPLDMGPVLDSVSSSSLLPDSRQLGVPASPHPDPAEGCAHQNLPQ